MKNLKLGTAALVMMAGFAAKPCQASNAFDKAALIQHDVAYEQALRYEASPDKTITPAKVLRWMRGLHGQVMAAPSQTEFQPIVNVNESHVRLIAAIAYKF